VTLPSAVLALWGRPRVRIPIAIAAFAVVTVFTYLLAHPRMLTGFPGYDDEGYMLTAIKAFADHGALYDGVFTQYGPFYYEFWGGIFSAFGIPITHETGRLATMVVWVVSALGVGLVALRLTASLLLGLATQMLVFTALGVATNEPMHPGGLIVLLLVSILAVAMFVRDRASPYPLAVLGGLLAALILVKINVGAFAVASVALLCVVSYPALLRRRWLRPLVELAVVALPLVLMLSKLDEGWARHYAIHVALAALAIVVVLRARSWPRRDDGELSWLLGGFAVLAGLVCATILASGTSLDGLIRGVIEQPLRQGDAFTLPMQTSGRGYAIDLLGLAGAAAYLYVQRQRAGTSASWVAGFSFFSLAVGLMMAFAVSGKGLPWDAGEFSGRELSMLAFAWVALVPPPHEAESRLSFPRMLLVLLAALQALHAYPVAGSQTLWSAFLLIPVAAICVNNGVRGLAAVIPDGAERRAIAGFGAVAALIAFGFIANENIRKALPLANDGYDNGVSLGLPGAESIHGSEEDAALYGGITAAIEEECPAVVMLPGKNSFYLWTGQEPPSYTATGWPTLFDDEAQRKVIADTRSIPDLCQLRNIPSAEGWSNGPIPPGPLVSYMYRDFTPIARWGDYELLRR
jgi:hypothetical protein